MDILFNGFFDSCSLPTVIIAVAVTLVVFIINLLLKDKIPKTIKAFLPFSISLVAYIVFDIITIKAIIVREDALYAGFICASLSTVLTAVIRKIKRGESLPISANLLLIESLLTDLIEKDNLQQTASDIHDTIENERQQPDLTKKVSTIIENATSSLDQKQAEFIAVIIIQAVESLSGQKTK